MKIHANVDVGEQRKSNKPKTRLQYKSNDEEIVCAVHTFSKQIKDEEDEKLTEMKMGIERV